MSVTAGIWSLSRCGPESAESFLFLHKTAESLFEEDNRKLVPPEDFAPGGKYRAIVKLQMRYERQAPDDQRWAMGTGWLIRNDLLVTAGHCAFDWKEEGGLGRCVQIKAYIGYNGKDSINSPDVQFRMGKKMITTGNWLKSPRNRTNDVSFVQLDKPFTGVTPMQYNTTPTEGKEILGVVGYPGDKRYNNLSNGEHGAQMYEEYQQVNWNLQLAGDHMLEYRINTYAGQSGSPVIRQGRNASIAVHVYGGPGNNSGSPISVKYGNPYDAFVSALENQDFTTARTESGISYITLPVTTTETDSGTEEDFWAILKDILHVGDSISNVITAASPFLGPVGGPIAALAGVALGAAGRAAETKLPDQLSPSDGYAERAILAEAALQTVLKMNGDQVQELGILDRMKDAFTKLSKQTKQIAPVILPVVMEPALRIALDALHKQESSMKLESAQPFGGRIPTRPPFAVMAARDDSFMKKLTEPITKQPSEEDLWGDIGSIISGATKFVNIAQGTLTTLGQLIPKTESAFEPSPTDRSLEVLCNRAIMGEAALQALQQTPPEAFEEGLFDFFKSTIQTISPFVTKFAPPVIKSVVPIVGSLLGAGESGFAEGASPPFASGLRRSKGKMTFKDVVEGKADTRI